MLNLHQFAAVHRYYLLNRSSLYIYKNSRHTWDKLSINCNIFLSRLRHNFIIHHPYLLLVRMVDVVGIPSIVLVAEMPHLPVEESGTHGVICDIIRGCGHAGI